MKLQATALNNLGIASIVSGVYAPVVGFLTGSLVPELSRFVAIVILFFVIGLLLIDAARLRLGKIVGD